MKIKRHLPRRLPAASHSRMAASVGWPFTPDKRFAAQFGRWTDAQSSADLLGQNWKERYQNLLVFEHQLETTAERFALLYDAAPVGYATLDRNGTIRNINLTGAELLGKERERLISFPLSSCVARSDKRKFLRHISSLRHAAAQASVELCFQRPDKTELQLQLVSRSTPDAAHSLGPVFTILTDVTAQRRTESGLAASRAQLASIVASAMDAIVSADENLRIIHFNAAAETMFGLRAEKAVGQPLTQLIPLRLRAAQERHFRRFLECGIRARPMDAVDEISGLRADGHEFPAEATIARTAGDGRKLLTVILRDISKRKQAEEDLRFAQNLLRKANQSLETRVQERTAELLGVNAALKREIAARRRLEQQLLEISEHEQQRIGQDLHDGLGQQLTGAAFLNDGLLKTLTKKSAPEAAESRRLAELLEQARIQTRQLSHGLLPVPAIPDGLVVALEEMARVVSNLRGVRCHLICPKAVPLRDNTAATHLFRIAQEAVNNALQHSRGTRISLTLAERGGSIYLGIRDNGRGIRARNAGAKSTSHGLQIMKSRCEAIGADLILRRLRPHGTLVECRLPIRPARLGQTEK